MTRKRHKEVRKISAGDLVRFQKEKKLAWEGEKTGTDLIFSRLLIGKNIRRSEMRAATRKNRESGFLSLENKAVWAKWKMRKMIEIPKRK